MQPNHGDLRMQLAIALDKKIHEMAPDLGLEVLVTPYGDDGIRVVVLKGIKKGVRTLSVKTFGPIKTSFKDFVNGVFGAMWPEVKPEVEQLQRVRGSFVK